MDKDRALREHLLYLLGGGGAHLDFESVVKDFPVASINEKVERLPYTAWQIVEHMRIAQSDILEFSRSAAHTSPPWPEGYWPAADEEADEQAWHRSLAAFRADLGAMTTLVEDSSNDLYAPIPHGDGQTLLREALLVADHNAYHLGALVLLKRLLQPDTRDRHANS